MKRLFIIGQGIYDPKMIAYIDLEKKDKKIKEAKSETERCNSSCMYKTAEAK